MGKIAEKRTKNRASDERHKPFTLRDYDRAYLDDKKKKSEKTKAETHGKTAKWHRTFPKGRCFSAELFLREKSATDSATVVELT